MEQNNTFWLTTSTTDSSPANNLSGPTQQQKDTDLTSVFNQSSMMNFASIFAGATAAVASTGTNMLSGPRMPPLNQIGIPPASQLSKGTTFLPVNNIQAQAQNINPLAPMLTSQIITSTANHSLNSITPLTTTIYTLPLPTDPIQVPKNFIQQAAAASGLTASSSGQNLGTNIMLSPQRVTSNTPMSSTTQGMQAVSPARPMSVHQQQQQPVGPTYQCGECGKSFENSGQLSYHTFVTHAQLQARPHKCTACPESFFLVHHLRDHMRAIHLSPEQSGGPPFTCSECMASFDDGGHLNLHLYMVHTIQGPKNANQQHPCTHCGKNFIKPSLLSAHIRNVHNGQIHSLMSTATVPAVEVGEVKSYKCDECGRGFKTSGYLKQHMVSVHEKPLKCMMCSKGFGRKSDLKRHMRGVHMRERPHICTKCGWTFAEFGNLKHHIQAVHTREKNFRCMYCDKTFSLSSYLRTHLVRMHNVVSENSKTQEVQESHPSNDDVLMRLTSPGTNPSIVRLATNETTTADVQTIQLSVSQTHVNRCYECGQTFENPQMLQTHVMSTHSQPFWCTVCGEGFTLASQLQLHLQLRHSSDDQINQTIQTVDLQASAPVTMEIPDTMTSQPSTTMNIITTKCQFCGEIFETDPEKHLCSWKKFEQSEAVCAAAMAIADERPHSCTDCGKRFKTTTHLKQHIRCVHSKERPYKCSHCEKSFARTSDLNRHVKGVHQRLKPVRNSMFVTLKCSECGAIYAETSQLKRHIYTTHLRGRPSFKCADCQEGFSDELTFQSHICHEEERPHVCSFCSKRFSLAPQLRRHLRAAHGKNSEDLLIHRCFQCNRNFGRPIDLERHIQAVHLKEKPHKCTLCGKSFGLQGNLNKHVRAVHLQEKPHQCIECGKRFAHVGVLKRHLRDIHFYDKKITVKLKLAQMQLHQRTIMQNMTNVQEETAQLKTNIMMSQADNQQLEETVQTISGQSNDINVANGNSVLNNAQTNDLQTVRVTLSGQSLGNLVTINSQNLGINVSSGGQMEGVANGNTTLQGVNMQNIVNSPRSVQIVNASMRTDNGVASLGNNVQQTLNRQQMSNIQTINNNSIMLNNVHVATSINSQQHPNMQNVGTTSDKTQHNLGNSTVNIGRQHSTPGINITTINRQDSTLHQQGDNNIRLANTQSKNTQNMTSQETNKLLRQLSNNMQSTGQNTDVVMLGKHTVTVQNIDGSVTLNRQPTTSTQTQHVQQVVMQQ